MAYLSQEVIRMKKLLCKPSLEFYQSIFEHNPDAIFILSIEGFMVEVNQAVTELFGYSKNEVQGFHYQNFIVPEYFDITNQHF
jgi:PAS domain S-box-containing protein